MEEPVSQILGAVRRGDRPLDALARLGEGEPEAAVAALRAALEHPDLGSAAPAWGPAVLLSARPAFAARQLLELATRYRERRSAPLDPASFPAVPRILGASNFLARSLLRHPEWCDDLRGDPPPPPEAAPDADWAAIRTCKYRGFLRIAARDLLGRPFPDVLRELSDLADRCLAAGLACAAAERRAEAPALLALGKLGGRELNLASDVDLLFLYENPSGEFDPAWHEAAAAVVRALKTGLEAPSEEGFGYRVDLDLRPEGRGGVIVNSVDAALTYYETFGAEWERQMLIRLRPVAGAPAASERFRKEIAPFVYRRSIDPGATREARAMKARIEDERRRAGRNLELELKEGPGGIRDVEFLVQELQLFYGGRHPDIRGGNVLEALAAIEKAEILEPAVAEALADAYVWLRRAEHAVQLAEERQTHQVPEDRAGQIALARRMGYRDAEAASARDRFRDDWTSVRAAARTHFDALVLGGEG